MVVVSLFVGFVGMFDVFVILVCNFKIEVFDCLLIKKLNEWIYIVVYFLILIFCDKLILWFFLKKYCGNEVVFEKLILRD